MLHRSSFGIAILLLAGPAVQGCSTLDELVFGPAPAADARGVNAALLEGATPFPPVGSVPPRPRLSYSVQQERAIVDSLIGDRENARYTADVVRYRAGRADAPPLGPPPRPAAVEGGAVVGPIAAVSPGMAGTSLDDDSATSDTDRLEALERDRSELDDGGLDDFVRDLVDETERVPDLDTETAVIDRRRADRPQIPGRKGKESAFQRLWYWLVGDDEEPPPKEAAAAPAEGVAVAGSDDAGAESGPKQTAAVTKATAPEVAAGDARPPALKPDEGADPPAPAPAKPGDGGGSGPGADGAAPASGAS